MLVFTKSVLLPAEIEAVFAFHRDPRNLEHVQPPGAEVIDADLPPLLELNSICSLTVKVPLGIQQWKIQVDQLEMDTDTGHAVMVDRAIQSPFEHWVHRHEFELRGEKTLMRDVVEFYPPGGPMAWLLILPSYVMLQVLFMIRHAKTVRYFSEQPQPVKKLS